MCSVDLSAHQPDSLIFSGKIHHFIWILLIPNSSISFKRSQNISLLLKKLISEITAVLINFGPLNSNESGNFFSSKMDIQFWSIVTVSALISFLSRAS